MKRTFNKSKNNYKFPTPNKAKKLDKNTVYAYILLFFFIFWSLASVLGIIAFFRSSREKNNSIVASAAELTYDEQVIDLFVNANKNINLFSPSSFISFMESRGGSSTVNYSDTSWSLQFSFSSSSYDVYICDVSHLLDIDSISFPIECTLIFNMMTYLGDIGSFYIETDGIRYNISAGSNYTVPVVLTGDNVSTFGFERTSNINTVFTMGISNFGIFLVPILPTSGIAPIFPYEKAFENLNNDAYNLGYDNGYDVGVSDGKIDGYDEGYSIGNVDGYNRGYQEGVDDSNSYNFSSLLSAVIDVPIKAFSSLFNFELLGINLANFFYSLLTVMIILAVVKFII